MAPATTMGKNVMPRVAALLDVTYETLVYYLYELGDRRYRTFQIAKRRGGTRTIAGPKSGLKAIQRKLAQVLSAIYRPRVSVQGFVPGRSIGTNALLHESSTYILNLDLEDFFPSINFGRVRGLFIAAPYAVPRAVATVMAQICCFQNALPQGAPTSPIIANMISSRMDANLQKLARRHRCLYSRYADDLTFSGGDELATKIGWLLAKMVVFCFFFLWFRATFPRYRYDQIMRLGWKVLIPITLVWIAVEGLLAWLELGPWAA